MTEVLLVLFVAVTAFCGGRWTGVRIGVAREYERHLRLQQYYGMGKYHREKMGRRTKESAE